MKVSLSTLICWKKKARVNQGQPSAKVRGNAKVQRINGSAHDLKHMLKVMAWAYMPAAETGSLIFVDELHQATALKYTVNKTDTKHIFFQTDFYPKFHVLKGKLKEGSGQDKQLKKLCYRPGKAS